MNSSRTTVPPNVLPILRSLLDAASSEPLPPHIMLMLQGLQAQLDQAGLCAPAEQLDDPMGVDPALETS